MKTTLFIIAYYLCILVLMAVFAVNLLIGMWREMQGGKKPTKAQQAWHDWQREQGCANCGASNPAIHHCAGSTAKHNKIHIGQWWTLPLCEGQCHQGPGGIHKNLSRFRERGMPKDYSRKQIEKRLFGVMLADYCEENHEAPMPADVVDAIMEYHR